MTDRERAKCRTLANHMRSHVRPGDVNDHLLYWIKELEACAERDTVDLHNPNDRAPGDLLEHGQKELMLRLLQERR
jgi:hypothetical protein